MTGELKYSHAKTLHDGLPLPGGRKVGGVGGELVGLLVKLGIPGVSHEHGRGANIEAYAKHVEGIRKAGADKALAEWLGGRA